MAVVPSFRNITHAVSFSVGTLITYTINQSIKAYLISVFQHGSSNPVNSEKIKSGIFFPCTFESPWINHKTMLSREYIKIILTNAKGADFLSFHNYKVKHFVKVVYIVGSRGASQLGGSLLGIPLGYKSNKL